MAVAATVMLGAGVVNAGADDTDTEVTTDEAAGLATADEASTVTTTLDVAALVASEGELEVTIADQSALLAATEDAGNAGVADEPHAVATGDTATSSAASAVATNASSDAEATARYTQPPITPSYRQPPSTASYRLQTSAGNRKDKAPNGQEAKPKPALAPQPPVVLPARSYGIPAEIPNGEECLNWLYNAGVEEIDTALYLISKESGCDPYAVNRQSGACGVAQELPCGKSKCEWGDGQCQVHWMNDYVHERYGSWAAAVAFWRANRYY